VQPESKKHIAGFAFDATQENGLGSAEEELGLDGAPALRIISLTFALSTI